MCTPCLSICAGTFSSLLHGMATHWPWPKTIARKKKRLMKKKLISQHQHQQHCTSTLALALASATNIDFSPISHLPSPLGLPTYLPTYDQRAGYLFYPWLLNCPFFVIIRLPPRTSLPPSLSHHSSLTSSPSFFRTCDIYSIWYLSPIYTGLRITHEIWDLAIAQSHRIHIQILPST